MCGWHQGFYQFPQGALLFACFNASISSYFLKKLYYPPVWFWKNGNIFWLLDAWFLRPLSTRTGEPQWQELDHGRYLCGRNRGELLLVGGGPTCTPLTPWSYAWHRSYGRPGPRLISSIKLYNLPEYGQGLVYWYPPMPSIAPGTWKTVNKW